MSEQIVDLSPRFPEADFYPVASDERVDWRSRLESIVGTPVVQFLSGLRRGYHRRVALRVSAMARDLAQADDAVLDERLEACRKSLSRRGFAGQSPIEALALIRELAYRHLGQRPFNVQLMGASYLLSGLLAEMETGEGKTLTAGLAAAVAALSGEVVHVITANDYLAARDASHLRPLYEACGLTVAAVAAGQTPAERRKAYLADITYCSNKEIAFDYMRDRLVLGSQADGLHLKLERLYRRDARASKLLLRGLRFAIVDEADSILIDESRTPLIISGETDPNDEQEWAEAALMLARCLEKTRDYRILPQEKTVELSENGREVLRDMGEEVGGIWLSRVRREDSVKKALIAIHIYHLDEDYLVRNGKVEIVDEYSGRVMPDRTWSDGLHQLIEVKEGCRTTGRRFVHARMTYQRFFRRYRHLCGMTGTAREVAKELWHVYRLPVSTVPTNKPLRRRRLGTRLCANADEKWVRVAEKVAKIIDEGRPVLIGTRSVKASEALSAVFEERGIAHRVLSAAQDQGEAEIIGQAGQSGQVTVATNMAGRGVDIRLGPGVAEKGGLHVILTERHEAGRIDRQLFGRCGRQGDSGSYEEVISWEDPLLKEFGSGVWSRLNGDEAFRRAQRRAERLHSSVRRDLLRHDQATGDMLAFSGIKE